MVTVIHFYSCTESGQVFHHVMCVNQTTPSQFDPVLQLLILPDGTRGCYAQQQAIQLDDQGYFPHTEKNLEIPVEMYM